MTKFLSTLLILTTIFLLCACGGTGMINHLAFSDDPNAITEASANIVMLTTYDKSGDMYKTGSGFPAFEDGCIVTNYHVIEGSNRIEGNTEDEMFFKIDEIVVADKERDIAILKTNAKTGLTPLTLGDTSALQKGEKVVAIGSPLGLINTVSDGMYSNRCTDDGQEYLQFTAAISSGSSGGALFNDKGEVIGITSASYTDGQNLNLAIPGEVIQDVWAHKDDEPVEIGQDRDWITLDEYLDTGITTEQIDNSQNIKVQCYVSSKFRFAIHDWFVYRVFMVSDEEDVLGYDYSLSSKWSSEKERAVDEEGNNSRFCLWLYYQTLTAFQSLNIGDRVILLYDSHLGRFTTIESINGNLVNINIMRD